MLMCAGARVCGCVRVRVCAYNSLYGQDFALYKYFYYQALRPP